MAKISKVITDDGSITFHNSDVDETYHSSSGALDEALRKHVIPTDVVLLAKKNSYIVIGDVCFGLGYNSLVAIAEVLKVDPSCSIQVFAFENDYDILNEIPNLVLPKDYSFAHQVLIDLISPSSIVEKTDIYSLHLYSKDNLTISLYVGDVLSCLPLLSDNVLSVVFFDPFSPKKHPLLWGTQLLSDVFRVMDSSSILSTYSCARMVRDNLKEVGFIVKDGPSVGRRSPSTLAVKN